MKADRFCKVENMTPEEAIKSINECSWESAAMAMPPYWEVKIIHGKGENPLLWGACYQIRAASINTDKQGKRYITSVYDMDGQKVLTLPERSTEAQGFETPTCSGCELKFDSVTMLWHFSTADSDGLEYHIWEEDEMEDTENE